MKLAEKARKFVEDSKSLEDLEDYKTEIESKILDTAQEGETSIMITLEGRYKQDIVDWLHEEFFRVRHISSSPVDGESVTEIGW